MRQGVRAGTLAAAVFLLAGPSPGAQSDPVTVVEAMIKAFNEHDVEKAVSFFSEDCALTLRPAYPSLDDRTYSGRDVIRKWVEDLIGNDFKIEIAVRKVEGNNVQTETRSWQNITRRLGLAPVVGIEDYVVQNGRITSLTWTSSNETRQKFSVLRQWFFAGIATVVVLLTAFAWWAIRRVRRARRARVELPFAPPGVFSSDRRCVPGTRHRAGPPGRAQDPAGRRGLRPRGAACAQGPGGVGRRLNSGRPMGGAAGRTAPD